MSEDDKDFELLCWLVSEADRHEQLYAHHRGDQMAEAFHSVNAIMCKKAAERIDELKTPLPSFFNDIIRKLEFSAEQSELWENPEDVGVVAIQYRALAMKLKMWMEKHG